MKKSVFQLSGRSLILDIRLISVNNCSFPIICCGLDDGKISLMVANSIDSYQPVLYLPGHEDWVTSLNYIVQGNLIKLLNTTIPYC